MRGATRVTWAFGCATVVTLAAAGCGGGGGGGAAAGSDAGIVRAFWTDPQNPLEPANTNEVQGGKVLEMTFRGLKRYNPRTGKAENAVAESIKTDDQQNFDITLKKGWKFSDGTPVTAKSFVDAWNYGALVTNKQVSSYFFEYIDGYDDVHPENESAKPKAKKMSGLKVTGKNSFKVKLNQKFSQWPDTLGYAAFSPLPGKFFTDHENWLKKPVGNGPYKVDSYTKGQSMRLSVNKEYAGPDKPKNKGVELKVYTDQNTGYTDLQAGNLDVFDELPAGQLKNAERDLDGRYINQPAGILQTLSFPLYRKEWQTEKAKQVRVGLSMAINRKEVTEKIYQGTRKPAGDLTSPVLTKSGGYEPDMCGEVCQYDPKEAKKLIEDAGGLPGGKVTLTSNVDTGSHRQWMDAVCNSINNTLDKNDACTVNPVPTFSEFRKDIAGKKLKSMFRTGWQMDYPLIQNFLQPLYYTDASSNDAGYSDKRVDKLIDEANAAGEEEAVGKFQKAEEIVLKDLPAIPLWYQDGNAGYSERVSDVRLNPFSVPVFTDIRVK
ncbi:peptide ABC transporter substrate-binding protein [Streptomyces abyssalis]|uniref:Peptide ABC transporter substrate-binding protein n=1 Tax=Streptomyces abyssalis TaxID=933944 RepID=A0A1E7JG74_9ACTN|nr:ABC transporter substrate-binding protein [Streptomyces abyssalis]OEU85475.1 peptide ABC transporter substrate-binding protein [Streptomyces abyssalis]OEU93062.1 peptide ABC transporter substrate-binding protein [Streptomyces abyssalis]OEV27258.1 peptide ABC transporter substrate-binding protein [Streptomyces nanshensis]